MKRPSLSLRWRIATALVFAAVAVAPFVLLVDRIFGRDVVLVSGHKETAALGRVLAAPADPVTETARSVDARPVRVLVLQPRKVIHPSYDPTLSLLPVNRGRRPLEIQTIYSIARSAIVTLLTVATVVILIRRKALLRLRAAMARCSDRG